MGVRKACKDYRKLSQAHQTLLPNYLSQMEDVRRCIDKNYTVILHMLAGVEHMFQQDQEEEVVETNGVSGRWGLPILGL